MAARVEIGDGELASSSFWLPSPMVQVKMAPSVSRSNRGTSSGSRALRPGDWRRAAAAETDGEPVEDPADNPRYGEYTPNIDDVHSPASVNFDNGAGLLLGSPLLPRALAVGPGRALDSAIGCMSASPLLGSPSSAISLSEGEASFRLDSPVQDESPLDVSPIRPRRGMPVDSELSTPGSDGYASPHVVFGPVHPSSMLRSSVQNPLYVDRPTPSETDNVAKALVLSPCADRSTASRQHRRTFESGWSSSSPSAERSISLNPSQREERSSPLTVSQVTPRPSPAVSSARQLLPLVPQGDIDTPRRIIKSLSMSHEAAHLGLSRGLQASTPYASQVDAMDQQDSCLQCSTESLAGATLTATPCSMAALVNADKASVSLGRMRVAESRSPSGKILQPSGANFAGSGIDATGHTADLDDTALVDRVLDQTPRKTGKPVSQSCDQRQVASGQAPTAIQGEQTRPPKRMQEPVVHPELALPVAPAGTRGGSILRSFVSCTFLVLVAVLIGNRAVNNEWWNHAPRPVITPVFDLGPACIRELYPGEHGLMASKTCPRVDTDATSLRQPGAIVKVPIFLLQLPTCHILEGLLLPVVGSSLSTLATFNQPGPLHEGADTSADFSDAAAGCLPVLGPVEAAAGDAMQHGNTFDIPVETYITSLGVNVVTSGDALLPDYVDSNSGSGLELQLVADEAASADHDASALQSGNDVDGPGSDCGSVAGHEDLDLLELALVDLGDHQDGSDMPAGSLNAHIASAGDALLQNVEEISSASVALAPPTEDSMTPFGAQLQLSDELTTGVTVVGERVSENDAQWIEDENVQSSDAAAPVMPGETAHAVAHFPADVMVVGPEQSAEVIVAEPSAEITVAEPSAQVKLVGQPAEIIIAEPSVQITNAEQSTEVMVNEQPEASSWLFSARLYGWNLPEFLLGAVAACLAGGLLAWTIDSLRPHVQRRQPSREVRIEVAVAQPFSAPTSQPVGRILRPKWPLGTTPADVTAVHGALPENSGALLEQGTGSLVWTGNKLVYFEG